MSADGGEGSAGDADADGSSDRAAGSPRCPHCDAAMFKRHCKYVCPQHGVIIDCSDPFR
ncbi:HVO_2523 family zinc finger protein [Natrinema marinum]|uniref:HVO_2523 family zinc finger protein n=1 Tax=Natrinema marinum TaxID=2961598 RepID=UPI0020C86EF1|nr:HVO_2523 family zinc finger protein [Natrinema marinum]